MKFTLITGASSGIGAQYARQSAAAGQNLILVSNQPQPLQELSANIAEQYGVTVKSLDIDLSACDAAQRVYDAASGWGEVDCLISNAGVLHFGKFNNTSTEYIDFITALHCTTPMKLCRLFGADMARRGYGKILIMSSMTAWTPYPTMSLYGSTKVLLKNFAQSLWYELRECGVSVTAVFPGAVDTPLYNLGTSARKWLRAFGVMSTAESVARKGLRAMNRCRRRCVPGLFTKVVVVICRLLPAVALLPIVKIPAIRRILDRL